MSSTTFSFVTLSGDPTIKRRENIRTVKSHVMRRIHEENQDARSQKREREKRVKMRYYTKRPDGGKGRVEEKRKGGSEMREVTRIFSCGRAERDLSESLLTGCDAKACNKLRLQRRSCSKDEREMLLHKARAEEMSASPSQTVDLGNTTYSVPFLNLMDSTLFPYQCLSIPATPRIIELLQYDLKSMIRTSVHADPTGQHFDHFADDPARIYVTIAHAAMRSNLLTLPWLSASSSSTSISQLNSPTFDVSGADRRIVRDQGWAAEGIYYFSRAIAILNKNLDDERKRAGDNMIACVSMFANMENLIGLSENATIHLNAVERMVSLRGGLNQLGMNGILRRLVLWSDLLHSIRSEVLPRFPLQDIALSEPMFNDLPSILFHQKFTPSQALLSLHTSQDVKILSILQRLHDLATVLNAFPNSIGQELPLSIQYPDRVYVIEYEIICTLYSNPSAEFANWNSSLPKCMLRILLHACLLYIYTNLRQTPVGGTMRRILSLRLQSCIQRAIDADTHFEEFRAEMLWACILGLATAEPREFWLGAIEKIAAKERLQTSRNVEKDLVCMPVLEMTFRRSCERIWHQSFCDSRGDTEVILQNYDML